jgi:hypothetical protein
MGLSSEHWSADRLAELKRGLFDDREALEAELNAEWQAFERGETRESLEDVLARIEKPNR